MALSNGPNLGLLVHANDGEAHGNELRRLLRGVDALVQARVKDKDLAAPPTSPVDGDCYLVAASATGAWAGWTNRIARWSAAANAWESYVPKEGWEVAVEDENVNYRYSGNAWLKQWLDGSAAYDPPSIAAGGYTTTNLTVAGAQLGDFAVVSFSLSVGSLVVSANVTAANTVTVSLYNPTAAVVDLANGTLHVRCWKL